MPLKDIEIGMKKMGWAGGGKHFWIPLPCLQNTSKNNTMFSVDRCRHRCGHYKKCGLRQRLQAAVKRLSTLFTLSKAHSFLGGWGSMCLILVNRLLCPLFFAPSLPACLLSVTLLGDLVTSAAINLHLPLLTLTTTDVHYILLHKLSGFNK